MRERVLEAREADGGDGLLGTTACFAARTRSGHGQGERDVRPDRLPRQELVELLEDEEPVGTWSADGYAVERHRPRLWLHEATDTAEDGRLATARGPEEEQALPLVDLEVDAVYRDDVRLFAFVGETDVVEGQDPSSSVTSAHTASSHPVEGLTQQLDLSHELGHLEDPGRGLGPGHVRISHIRKQLFGVSAFEFRHECFDRPLGFLVQDPDRLTECVLDRRVLLGPVLDEGLAGVGHDQRALPERVVKVAERPGTRLELRCLERRVRSVDLQVTALECGDGVRVRQADELVLEPVGFAERFVSQLAQRQVLGRARRRDSDACVRSDVLDRLDAVIHRQDGGRVVVHPASDAPRHVGVGTDEERWYSTCAHLQPSAGDTVANVSAASERLPVHLYAGQVLLHEILVLHDDERGVAGPRLVGEVDRRAGFAIRSASLVVSRSRLFIGAALGRIACARGREERDRERGRSRSLGGWCLHVCSLSSGRRRPPERFRRPVISACSVVGAQAGASTADCCSRTLRARRSDPLCRSRCG